MTSPPVKGAPTKTASEPVDGSTSAETVPDAAPVNGEGGIGPDAFDFDGDVRYALRRLARAHQRYGERSDLNELAETIYAATEDKYASRADETWLARQHVEKRIGQDFEDVFNTFDIVVGVSGSALRHLADSRRPLDTVPEPVAYAMALLQVRALRVAHEVCALLRAGFASGAGGRWRTLYEVYITAAVLAQGNQHTCTRYYEHRWVMLARDHRRVPEPDWSGGRTPEQMRRGLVARFGAEYDGTYGWAAELTKRRLKVARPKFSDLERLSLTEVPRRRKMGAGRSTEFDTAYRTRVLRAHHRVHADALGVLDLTDGTGQLHSGALHRGIAGVAYETVHVLGECMRALIQLRLKYAPNSAETVAAAALIHEVFMLSERHLLGHAVQTGDIDRESYFRATTALAGNDGR